MHTSSILCLAITNLSLKLRLITVKAKHDSAGQVVDLTGSFCDTHVKLDMTDHPLPVLVGYHKCMHARIKKVANKQRMQPNKTQPFPSHNPMTTLQRGTRPY